MRLVVVVALAGCTHWTTTQTYGPPTEVARRLLGSPQVEETESSNLSAGFSTVGESYTSRHYHGGYETGGLSGSHDSSKRTHCVQQAQVDYVQSVESTPELEHRAYDVAGSIVVGIAGIGILGAANAQYNSAEQFYEMDPSFFAKPSTPTMAYAIGGAALVGAGAWLVYSLTSLPKGPKPDASSSKRAWTETTYVEASGCGLVPADR
jgi:hypothetical protein